MSGLGSSSGEKFIGCIWSGILLLMSSVVMWAQLSPRMCGAIFQFNVDSSGLSRDSQQRDARMAYGTRKPLSSGESILFPSKSIRISAASRLWRFPENWRISLKPTVYRPFRSSTRPVENRILESRFRALKDRCEGSRPSAIRYREHRARDGRKHYLSQ